MNRFCTVRLDIGSYHYFEEGMIFMKFKVGDRVRLIENSFEDSGLREGECGTVIDVDDEFEAKYGADIRVAWDHIEVSSVPASSCEEE